MRREGEAMTSSGKQQTSQQPHKAGHSRSAGIQDVDYSIVVRAEKDMFLNPKVSPDMSCKNYREELLVGNRVQLL